MAAQSWFLSVPLVVAMWCAAAGATTNGQRRFGNKTFDCFFKSSCIDNACYGGASGVMCEQCQDTGVVDTSYDRLGGSCVKCQQFPWSVAVFAAVLALLVIVMARKGFTQSVATKVKLLFDALQLLLLTFRFPILWPTYSQRGLTFLSFAYLTPQMIFPACFFDFSTSYFLNWLVPCLALVAMFLVTWILDRVMRRKQLAVKGQYAMAAAKWLHRRTVLRRWFILLALVLFAPITSLVLRSYACEANLGTANVWFYEGDTKPNDTNRWLYNYNISCNSGEFQAITFFSTFILICYSVLGPLMLLFFTIRMRRWKLLAKKAMLHGAIYESYRANWCFMEPVVLIRKLVMVLIADIYPLAPILQLVVSLCLSTIYLLLVVLGGPFRQGKWSVCGRPVTVHNIFEVIITVLITGVQVVGVVVHYTVEDSRGNGGDPLDVLLLAIMSLMVVLWLIMFIAQLFAEAGDGSEDDLGAGEMDDQPLGSVINRATLMLRRNGKVSDSSKALPNEDSRDATALTEM